jgi:translation initiation factor 2 alpha subunit (eIF-2alpha)
MAEELQEGDVVLCTVTKIVGTTVFVKIKGNGEGTIITSEIAPGRIRNLRRYVVPNKKIVCKVLDIDKSRNIHLSLRRTTSKETREVMSEFKKQKSIEAALKTALGEKAEKIIEKIKQKSSIIEFFENVKEKPEILEKLITKDESKKIIKILKERREKEVKVKREILLNCEQGQGIKIIKKILPPETKYIAAGKFSISFEGKDYKEANKKASQTLEEIEQKAKEQRCEFSFIEKK